MKKVAQKVFFSMGVSFEGYIAGPNASQKNPMGDGGEKLHKWVFEQRIFREILKLGEGGKTGQENSILEVIVKRTGASIMDSNMFFTMFKEGEVSWPDQAQFYVPIFVLTKESREPWERPGGTFYFVTDGIERALEKARKAAGEKDVQINGGTNAIQQYLNAGLVDEFMLHYSPVFLGKGGLPLFANMSTDIKVQIKEAIPSKEVTHVTYEVLK